MNDLGLDTIIVGDTLDFTTAVAGYPASDGWTLKYRVIPRVSGTPFTLTAATASDGTSYRVTQSPAQTLVFVAGDYTWYAWVEKVGARVTIDDGLVTVKGDPSALATFDGRTHARKMLDQIEAALEGFATSSTVKSYTIGTRQMTKADVPEILTLRDRYRAEVANEIAREKIADGLGNPRNIGIRFKRV